MNNNNNLELNIKNIQCTPTFSTTSKVGNISNQDITPIKHSHQNQAYQFSLAQQSGSDQATQSHTFFSMNQIGKSSAAMTNDIVFGDSSNRIELAANSSQRPILKNRTSIEQFNQISQIQVLPQFSQLQEAVQYDVLEGVNDRRSIFSKENFGLFEESKFRLQEDIPQLEFDDDSNNMEGINNMNIISNNNNNNEELVADDLIDMKHYDNIQEEKKSEDNSQIVRDRGGGGGMGTVGGGGSTIKANTQPLQLQQTLTMVGGVSPQQQQQQQGYSISVQQEQRQNSVGQGSSKISLNAAMAGSSSAGGQINQTYSSQRMQYNNLGIIQEVLPLEQMQQNQQQQQQNALSNNNNNFQQQLSGLQQHTQKSKNSQNKSSQNPQPQTSQLGNQADMNQQLQQQLIGGMFSPNKSFCRNPKVIWQKKALYIIAFVKHFVYKLKQVLIFYKPQKLFGKSPIQLSILRDKSTKDYFQEYEQLYDAVKNQHRYRWGQSSNGQLIHRSNNLSSLREELLRQAGLKRRWGRYYKKYLIYRKKVMQCWRALQKYFYNHCMCVRRVQNVMYTSTLHFLLLFKSKKDTGGQLIPVFDPESTGQLWWSGFVMLCTIFSLFYLPLLAAFGQNPASYIRDDNKWHNFQIDVASYFLVLVYASDMIVKGNSTYSFKGGIQVKSHSAIILHYLNSSFALDALALLALILFFFAFLDRQDSVADYCIIMPLIYAPLRLLFFGTSNTVVKALRQSFSKQLIFDIIRTIHILLVLLLYFHYIACFWFWLGSYQQRQFLLQQQTLVPNEVQLKSWEQYQGGWLFQSEHDSSSYSSGSLQLIKRGLSSQYIHCLFEAIYVFFNNGFSNQNNGKYTDLEKLFLCVVVFLSLLMYAFLLYNLFRFIKEQVHKSLMLEKERAGLRDYFNGLMIDPYLREHAMKYLEENKHEQAQISQQTLESGRQLQCLSKNLRHDIEIDIRLKALHQVSVFTKYFTENFIRKVAEYAEEVIYAPEELIISANSFEIPYLYIVLIGQVESFIEMSETPQGRGTAGPTPTMIQQANNLNGINNNNNILSFSVPSIVLNNNQQQQQQQHLQQQQIHQTMGRNSQPNNNNLARSSLFNNNNSNLMASTKQKQHATIEVLGAYSYFGDLEFFQQEYCAQRSVRSVGISKLLRISLLDFQEVLPKFPYDREAFCFLRDSLICNNDFGLVGRYCLCCSQSSHTITDCPFLFFRGVEQKMRPHCVLSGAMQEKRRRPHKRRRQRKDKFNSMLKKLVLLKVTEQYYLNNTEMLENYLKAVQMRRQKMLQVLKAGGAGSSYQGGGQQQQHKQMQYLQLQKFNKEGLEEPSDCVESVSESFISQKDIQGIQTRFDQSSPNHRQRVSSLQLLVSQQQGPNQEAQFALHPIGSSGSSIASGNNISAGATSPLSQQYQQQSSIVLQQQQNQQPGGQQNPPNIIQQPKQTTFFQQQPLPDINEEQEKQSSHPSGQSSMKSILSNKRSENSSKHNSSSFINNSKSQQSQPQIPGQPNNSNPPEAMDIFIGNNNGSGVGGVGQNSGSGSGSGINQQVQGGSNAKNISSATAKNVFYNKSVTMPEEDEGEEDYKESNQQFQFNPGGLQQQLQQQQRQQIIWNNEDNGMVFGGEMPKTYASTGKIEQKKLQTASLQQQSSIGGNLNGGNGPTQPGVGSNRPWQSQNLIAEEPQLDTNRILDGIDLASQSQISMSQKMGQHSIASKPNSSKRNSMKSWNSQDWQKMFSRFSNMTTPVANIEDLQEIEQEEDKDLFMNKNATMQSFTLYFPKHNIENVLERINKKALKKQKQLKSYQQGQKKSPTLKSHSTVK